MEAAAPNAPERVAPKDAAILVHPPGRKKRLASKYCEFGAVVRFAYGLQKDLSAVAAAVDTSWSAGPVEGQANRLKTIKRQMYGRAGFELLRARALSYEPIASSGPALTVFSPSRHKTCHHRVCLYAFFADLLIEAREVVASLIPVLLKIVGKTRLPSGGRRCGGFRSGNCPLAATNGGQSSFPFQESGRSPPAIGRSYTMR